MMQITGTTDGKFIGIIFDPDKPIILNGMPFFQDEVHQISEDVFRYSNSNYIIDAKKV